MLEELLNVGIVIFVVSGAILFAVGFGFGTVNIQNAKLKMLPLRTRNSSRSKELRIMRRRITIKRASAS